MRRAFGAALLLFPAAIPAQPVFVEVTGALDFPHHTGRGDPGQPPYFMPAIMGSGVGVMDHDGDGDLDLYLVQGRGPDRLFHNEGGLRFRGEPVPDTGTAYGMGIAIGDVDGNELPDVYRTGHGSNVLLLNRGNGVFEARRDGPNPGGWSASATSCDYDADGNLDLFVTRYMDYDPDFVCQAATGPADYCGPTDIPGLSDSLYRGLGDGRFEDSSDAAGIAAFPARGLGVVCHDFTGDGRLDFYVANDTEANHLWVNQGDGTFREEALLRGAALSGFGRPEAGMGVDIGDIDGDADFDILITHFADETNTVYLAGPDAGFVDGSIGLGFGALGLGTTGFGAILADFDLDGHLDAAIANGRVARPTGEPPREPFLDQYAEPVLLLRNTGSRFEDAGAGSPDLTGFRAVGRALAAGDMDGDGDPDLVFTAAGGSARLFRNDSAGGGDWLVVDVRGSGGTPDHGAAVVLGTGAGDRVARANPGVSYLASSDPRAYFGFPAGIVIRSLTVRWSDGERESFPVPETGRVVVLRRGEGR